MVQKSLFVKSSLLLFSLFILVLPAFAGDFTGTVRKIDDGAISLAYPALIEVKEGIKTLPLLNSMPDGSFRIPIGKSQTYVVKVSLQQYADTSFTFTTDKNGRPSTPTVNVMLKKHGVILFGNVRTLGEFIPIKEATVVLKNVMTREEKRITTEKDGAYRFKLLYENNYRLSVDKRSPGIFNKYRDTVMYISTIGINQPLEYRLDLRLEDRVKNTEGIEDYDPNQPVVRDRKPEVDVVTKTYKRDKVEPVTKAPVREPVIKVPVTKPTTPKPAEPVIEKRDTVKPASPAPAKAVAIPVPEVLAQPVASPKTMAELKADLEKAQKDLEEIKKREAAVLKAEAIKQKQKEKNKGVETVIIGDEPSVTPAQIAAIKLQAEKRLKQVQEEIELLKKK